MPVQLAWQVMFTSIVFTYLLTVLLFTGTEETTMKKYDLMHQINTRGTFMASKYALPHLKKSSNGKYFICNNLKHF